MYYHRPRNVGRSALSAEHIEATSRKGTRFRRNIAGNFSRYCRRLPRFLLSKLTIQFSPRVLEDCRWKRRWWNRSHVVRIPYPSRSPYDRDTLSSVCLIVKVEICGKNCELEQPRITFFRATSGKFVEGIVYVGRRFSGFLVKKVKTPNDRGSVHRIARFSIVPESFNWIPGSGPCFIRCRGSVFTARGRRRGW